MFITQEVRSLSVESLLPYARNSRTHSDEQVAALAASIREFGFTNPVLVHADGTIVAGHGRVLAARKLGMTWVPCIDVSHMTEAQMRAYVIADNKLAEQAGWDDDLLKIEIGDLCADGLDLGLTGFSQNELKKILQLAESSELSNYNDQSVPEKLLVMVECKTDKEQRAVLQLLTKRGHECRALTS